MVTMAVCEWRETATCGIPRRSLEKLSLAGVLMEQVFMVGRLRLQKNVLLGSTAEGH